MTEAKVLIERLQKEIIRLREEANMDDRAAEASTNPDAKPCFQAFAIAKRDRASDIETAIALIPAARPAGEVLQLGSDDSGAILNEIGLVLESRGYANMTNGRDINALLDQLEGAEAALSRYMSMSKVLQFYADTKNWVPGRWQEEPEDVVEGMICVDWQQEDGGAVPFADCGDRARKALTTIPVLPKADPDAELKRMVAEGLARLAKLSPEEQKAHWDAQRESFVRGQMMD